MQQFQHEGTIADLDWRNDNELASLSTDDQAFLWKVGQHEPLRKWRIGQIQKKLNSIAWDPAGSLLASTSEDNFAVLWTVRQDEHIGKFEGHTKSINSLAWSNTKGVSPLLATASRDTTVKIWDIEKQSCAMTLEGHYNSV